MRILVVEDEKKIAGFIKRGLKEEGYAVETAFNGEEGLGLAELNDYDLILLDVMLPGLDGMEVCRKLRGKGIDTPVIMLTAKDTVGDKIKGLDSGADDYITKPFAFEELLARVRAALRKKKDPRAGKLKVDDLELDPYSHKVARAGKNITLTSKEYALLEYLARNEGGLVTRTGIAEHVWGVDFDTETNVIDVYINYLRKKIDSGHKNKLIKTVRGRGYMLGG
jgi:heavy metal response regulator